MATINRGQFFLDYKAIKDGHQKPKFFIALTEGDSDEEGVVCFVINTEHRMDLYHVCCNKKQQKFVLYNVIHKFKFLEEPSSIMLNEPCKYYVREFYENNIKILDEIADEKLCREIKNCIDEGYILPTFTKLIKENYKK